MPNTPPLGVPIQPLPPTVRTNSGPVSPPAGASGASTTQVIKRKSGKGVPVVALCLVIGIGLLAWSLLRNGLPSTPAKPGATKTMTPAKANNAPPPAKTAAVKAAPQSVVAAQPSAPASQPVRVGKALSWNDPMDAPGNWKACGDLLKQSVLYEPNIDFAPNDKCLLMAKKLGFAADAP